MKRTLEEINSKIESGEANVFSAYEIKELIKNNETPSFEEVDVITCGTCGVMSGTAAIFNIKVAEAGVFKRAKNLELNGIPVTVGPCPNEWLGSVDLILSGTSKSLTNKNYGGGFLLRDIVEGKTINIKVETIDGEIIESSTYLDEMGTAQLIGSRMAFKNYTAFINPSNESVSSIFSAIPLEGNLSGLTFSGCGDLNPLQNDPVMNYIKSGCKILLNGAEGLVLANGTRSSGDKPNLMLTANIKEMDFKYLGGFKTGEGAEIFDTVAIPIPILNEEIYNNVLVKNSDIPLTVADIKGRHMPLDEITYADTWDGSEFRPIFDESSCIRCLECIVESICPTNAFKLNNEDKFESNSNNENSHELNGISVSKIDYDSCFGCGMCVHYCNSKSFNMNTGFVSLNINGNLYDVPIICRQSDRLRANKLSNKLKEMILNGTFKL